MPWIFSEIVHTFSFFFTCPLAKTCRKAVWCKKSKAWIRCFLQGSPRRIGWKLPRWSRRVFEAWVSNPPRRASNPLLRPHRWVFSVFFSEKKNVFFWHCFAVGHWSAWQWSCGDSMLGIYRSWMNLGHCIHCFQWKQQFSEVLILQQVLHQQEETSRIVVQDTHDAGWMYLPNGQDHRGEFAGIWGLNTPLRQYEWNFLPTLSDLCRYNS